MDKKNFFEQVKPGDYFHMEFEYDEDGYGKTQQAFCDGIVEKIMPNWSDPDNGYHEQDVILCSKLITVDGIVTDDMTVGCGKTHKYSFMSEDEKINFDNQFNQ